MSTTTRIPARRHLFKAAGLVTITTAAAHAGIATPLPPGVHTSSRVVQAAPGFLYNSGDRDATDPVGPIASEAMRTFGGSTITATSSAQYGLLTADLSFNGPLSSTTSGERFVQAFGESGFRDDTLTLTAPGFDAGDIVTISATFDLDIDLLLEFTEPRTGPGFGFQTFAYDLAFEVAGQTFTYAGEFSNSGAGATLTSGAAAPGEVTLSVDVPVGEAFSMRSRLSTAFYASAINASYASAFGVTSDTPGNFRFVNFSDLPLGAEITSDLPYFEPPIPTPAPAALALLAAGAGSLRRRRAHND